MSIEFRFCIMVNESRKIIHFDQCREKPQKNYVKRFFLDSIDPFFFIKKLQRKISTLSLLWNITVLSNNN